MSEDSFKNFMNKCRDTAKTVALTTAVVLSNEVTAAPNMPENDKGSDKNKIENFETSLKEQINEGRNVDFQLGDTKISVLREGNEVAVSLNDGEYKDADDYKTPKEAKEEYKKEQKEAFEDAPNDTTIVRTVEEFSRDGAMGAYSQDDKNITIYRVDNNERDIKDFVESLPSDENKTVEQREESVKENLDKVNSQQNKESVLVHEEQHRVNDKNNVYAPGLNPEQQGKLECWNEVSANVAQLVLANHLYQEQLKSGISKEEALKVFEGGDSKQFSFYVEALNKGLDPCSKEAKELMVQGTIKMWKDEFSKLYDEQICKQIEQGTDGNTFAGTLIGDREEYKKRVEKMFDSIDENPILKEKGVNIGNLSKYLPKEDFELTPKQKQLADEVTKKTTNFSSEQGKIIRDSLPGNDKKDQKNFTNVIKLKGRNLIKHILILSGRIKPTNSNSASNQGQVKTQTQANTNVNLVQSVAQRSQGR